MWRGLDAERSTANCPGLPTMWAPILRIRRSGSRVAIVRKDDTPCVCIRSIAAGILLIPELSGPCSGSLACPSVSENRGSDACWTSAHCSRGSPPKLQWLSVRSSCNAALHTDAQRIQRKQAHRSSASASAALRIIVAVSPTRPSSKSIEVSACGTCGFRGRSSNSNSSRAEGRSMQECNADSMLATRPSTGFISQLIGHKVGQAGLGPLQAKRTERVSS